MFAAFGCVPGNEPIWRCHMLQRLNPLRGGPSSLDGDIGAVKDFYFDDDTWTIRYVVADTGTWLQGRRVVIPLSALHAPDWDQRRIPVRLTRGVTGRLHWHCRGMLSAAAPSRTSSGSRAAGFCYWRRLKGEEPARAPRSELTCVDETLVDQLSCQTRPA